MVEMEPKGKRITKREAAEKYMRGATSISGAAEIAGITVWDMECYLVDAGFKSQYSVEDLKKDMIVLK